MRKRITEKQKAVLLYGFVFGYVLSFVFEGRVYYQITEMLDYNWSKQMLIAMICQLLGLLTAGLCVRSGKKAKRLMSELVAGCIVLTPFFLISNSIVGYLVIVGVAYISGMAVACWGAYYKEYVQPEERMQAITEALIVANLLMILAGLVATYVSAIGGLVLILLYLILGLGVLIKAPLGNSKEEIYERNQFSHLEKVALLLFFIFIVVATIDSGLMYGVFNTRYRSFEKLTSWFWAVPYIIALIIMKSFPKRRGRTVQLYIAFFMIGIGFVLNMLLSYSAVSYIVIDTLLLGAAGIIDLFWASTVGESFEYIKNPVRVLSIGWAANVLGVFIGGIISQWILQLDLSNKDMAVIALGVVCVSFVILPEMLKHLYLLLDSSKYINIYQEQTEKEHQIFETQISGFDKLTEREQEILQQILLGQSNKAIAIQLCISENTVKTHVRNILSKYEVTNRAQLISQIWQKEH